MSNTAIKFSRVDSAKFFRTLNKRINTYFKEKNIKKTGNWKLYLKAVFMFALLITPLVLVLTLSMPWWAQILCMITVGVGMAGVGMNVMHDANHGSYSKNKNVNNVLGFLVNFLGAYHINWKIQHNVLHHSFTNIDGYDEDISNPALRFSPYQERKSLNIDDDENIFVVTSCPLISFTKDRI